MGSCGNEMAEVKHDMKQFNLEDLQENFDQVFDDVLLSGEPIKITTGSGNAIIFSEEIWSGNVDNLLIKSLSTFGDS